METTGCGDSECHVLLLHPLVADKKWPDRTVEASGYIVRAKVVENVEQLVSDKALSHTNVSLIPSLMFWLVAV